MKTLMNVVGNWCTEYGPIFRINILSCELVFLNSPEYVQKLYGSKDLNYGPKAFPYNILKRYVGDGILMSTGDKWKSRRKVLTKHMFSFKTLQSYMKMLNLEGDTLISGFDTVIGQSSLPINKIVEKSVLNVVTQITLGKNATDYATQDETNFTFAEMINGGKEIISKKVIEPWYQIPQIWRFHPMSKFENDAVNWISKYTMKSLLEDDNGSGLGIKNDLLADGVPLDGILEEVMTLIVAGYETTSQSLQYFLFLLALNPHHQELCRKEVDSVFENETLCDSNGHLEYGAISKLKYLEMCLNETFRMLPTAFITMRSIEAPIELDKDLKLPAGTQVVVFTPGIHRNPKYFPNPEEFMPERFSPEEVQNRNTFSFLPFSAGPRNCIGYKLATMELLSFTARIIRHYVIETSDRLEDVVFLPAVTLTPEKPINFVIKRRDVDSL
ncbi:Cytochrome P450 4V2 [Orchesella cincta]|uniref:Cytochrome P450 4V2 n=1 Tax=Orchesella cincta TaxID=48709 RepID=A0A1D2MYG0_ORCCI|nr:Cytochrome P450 4V2 [Orchesella cincta]